VVEARRRCQICGPDLGRVADGDGPRGGRWRATRAGPGARGSRTSRSRPGLVAVALEPGEVRGQSLGEARREASQPLTDRRAATVRHEEFGGGQQHDPIDRLDRPLVGRVERPQRVDLVAEELDPDRQRHRWREDIHDPAAAGEFATAGNLRDGRIAEVEQVVQESVLVEPRARLDLARRVGQVVGRDRVLE